MSSLISQKLENQHSTDMNNLNEDNGDISARVHTFVRSVVDNGATSKCMAGPYCCPGDDGELARIYCFLGTAIIKSHIQMILANMWDRPTSRDIDQESSRLCTQIIVATERMRSFMFPQEIVQEMITRDHGENREITPSALYTCIKAVITLIYGLNGSTIEEGAIEGVTVPGVCMAIINRNPRSPTAEAEFPPQAQQIPLPHHKDLLTSHINVH